MTQTIICHDPADIFTLNVDAMINPVNTQGISEKGLAKEFASRFPKAQKSYKEACIHNSIGINKVYVTQSEHYNFESQNPKYIIHFATKKDWKNPSKYLYIILGLESLKKAVETHEIKSLAIPALGCGLGELKFDVIKELVYESLKNISNLNIFLMAPHK